MSIALGVTLGRTRLARRNSLVLLALGTLFVLLIGVLERATEPAYALDRTLLGVGFGLSLPLFAYLLFENVLERSDATALVSPLARHGADARTVTFGLVMSLAAACALAGLTFALVSLVATTGPGPRLARELFPCAWSGVLSGLAYAGLFALGSRFNRFGRVAVLLGDWLLGAGSSIFALPWPRAHVRSLLGGEPVLDLSQLASLAFLLAIAFAGSLASAAFGRH